MHMIMLVARKARAQKRTTKMDNEFSSGDYNGIGIVTKHVCRTEKKQQPN